MQGALPRDLTKKREFLETIKSRSRGSFLARLQRCVNQPLVDDAMVALCATAEEFQHIAGEAYVGEYLNHANQGRVVLSIPTGSVSVGNE